VRGAKVARVQLALDAEATAAEASAMAARYSRLDEPERRAVDSIVTAMEKKRAPALEKV